MAKARSDSVLKLRAERDPEFGAKVREWLHTEKTDTCPGGQRHAIEQLRADGITASGRMLSEFSQWWELRLECSDADQFAEQWIELLEKQFPGMSPEKIAEHRQTFFTLKAANAGDTKTFMDLEYLRLSKETAATKGRQKDADLKLAERRVVVMEKKIADAEKTLGDSKLSDAEKAERLRRIFKR